MRGTYCYLPILPARGGAFRAVRSLSSSARSRLVPLFNIPAPTPKDEKALDVYLAGRAEGIRSCQHSDLPVYVDVHDLAPELRTRQGDQPIAYLMEQLRMRGVQGIPVTGTETTRGADYVDAIRELRTKTTNRVCLRLARDELAEPKLLYSSVSDLLSYLAVEPTVVDVVLDFEFIGQEYARIEGLRATALEALQAICKVGQFRNIVLSGTSVPENLNKKTHGVVVRVPRVELALWKQVIGMLADPVPVALGDCGVIGAHHAPPGKPVNVPSRVRYTTASEHVFRRADRGEYQAICRELIESEDFHGAGFSFGDQQMGKAGSGRSGPGNPSMWVTHDTSHHLELVSAQSWGVVCEQGQDNRFLLPAPAPQPWLQPDLVS